MPAIALRDVAPATPSSGFEPGLRSVFSPLSSKRAKAARRKKAPARPQSAPARVRALVKQASSSGGDAAAPVARRGPASPGALHSGARPSREPVERLRIRLAAGRVAAEAELERFFDAHARRADAAWASRAVTLEVRHAAETGYLDSLGGRVGGGAAPPPSDGRFHFRCGTMVLPVPGLHKVAIHDAERTRSTREALGRSHGRDLAALGRRVEGARCRHRLGRDRETERLHQQCGIVEAHIARAEHLARRVANLGPGAALTLARATKAAAATSLARASSSCAFLASYTPADEPAVAAALRRAAADARSPERQRPSSAPAGRPTNRKIAAGRASRRPGTARAVADGCACCRRSLGTGGAVVIPEFGLVKRKRRDFCTYECAKEWNATCGPVLHRSVRNVLIDLQAGRPVELPKPPRYRIPGPAVKGQYGRY